MIRDWFALPTPGVDGELDRVSLELAWSSGDVDLDVRIENPAPEQLTGSPTWFSLAALRRIDGPSPTPNEHGLELWSAEDPALLALTERPEWDRGNLLGFDFLATAGEEASRMLSDPLAGLIHGALRGKAPRLAMLLGGAAGDVPLA